jgi:hypothetical protein
MQEEHFTFFEFIQLSDSQEKGQINLEHMNICIKIYETMFYTLSHPFC